MSVDLSQSHCKCWRVGALDYYSRSSYSIYIQGLADARKRARRSGLVQFFAVYQFDRGGILQFLQSTSLSVVESYICLIQFANCCNHAVRGSVVWTLTPDSTLCTMVVAIYSS